MRRALGNLLVAASSLVATLLVLEGVVAVFARPPEQVSEAETRLSWIEHDPLLGWRKRTNARATYKRREYTVEVSTNSRGLRDRERSYEAAPGVFRVLAVGDSFVEAYAVPLEATATQILEKALAKEGCAVEVINGGTQGYSTDQEYLFYRTEGVRYSPQVVALFFYYNDVLYNGRDLHFGTPKPRFALRNGALIQPGGPTPEPAPTPTPAPRAVTPRAKSPWRFVEHPLERSALVAWARERLRLGAPRAHNALARLGLWPPIEAVQPAPELRVYKRKAPPEIQEAWRLTERLLEALARESEARGSRFVVVYVPARMEIREGDWELTRLRYQMDDERWDRRLVATRLRQIGGAAGFPVLDLTESLAAEDRGVLGGPYYRYDLHWNALGQRIAAREVEGFLRARGWVPACAAP